MRTLESNVQLGWFKHVILNLSIGKVIISPKLLCLNQRYIFFRCLYIAWDLFVQRLVAAQGLRKCPLKRTSGTDTDSRPNRRKHGVLVSSHAAADAAFNLLKIATGIFRRAEQDDMFGLSEVVTHILWSLQTGSIVVSLSGPSRRSAACSAPRDTSSPNDQRPRRKTSSRLHTPCPAAGRPAPPSRAAPRCSCEILPLISSRPKQRLFN